MNTNKPNLDNYFDKIRSQEPLFSKDDARNLLETGSNKSANYQPHKKGITTMNIIISTMSLAAAVAVFSFRTNILELFNGEQPKNKTQIIALANTQQQETKPISSTIQHSEEGNQITSNTTISSNSNFQDNYESPKVKTIIVNVSTPVYTDTIYKDNTKNNYIQPKKIDVRGVHLIHLTLEQLAKLGVKIDCSGEDESLSFIDDWNSNPELCTVFEHGGFVNSASDEKEPNSATKYYGLRMITDNVGNRRITIFDDNNINQHFLSSNNQNICFIKTGDSVDSDYSNPKIKTQKIVNNQYSLVSFGKSNSNTTLHNGSTIQTSTTKTNEPDNGMFFNTSIDISQNTNDTNAILIFPQSTNSYNFHTVITNKKIVSNSLKNRDKDTIIHSVDNNLIRKNKVVLHLDSIQINSDDIFLNDSQFKNMNISLLKVDSSLNLQCKQLNLVDSSFNLQCKQLNLNSTFSNIPTIIYNVDVENEFEKKVLINKLIPVAVSVCAPSDSSNTNNFGFIAWFEPTNDFIDKLPDSIRTEIGKELAISGNTNEICQNSCVAGENPIFDIWRSCSGAIENMSVYPNPAKDQIKIKYTLNDSRNVSVSLHDVFGSKISTLASNVSKSRGEIEDSFVLNNINAGMYLVVVESENGEQAVQQIIVER